MDNRSFLSIEIENLLQIFSRAQSSIVEEEINLPQQLKEKKRLFGFKLPIDGIEVYNLFEEHWLIIADYHRSTLSPIEWHRDKFIKAIECIPKNDVIISLGNETDSFSFSSPLFTPLFSIHSGIKAFISHSNGEILQIQTPTSSQLRAHEFSFETAKKQLIIKGIDRNKHPQHQVFYHFLKKKD